MTEKKHEDMSREELLDALTELQNEHFSEINALKNTHEMELDALHSANFRDRQDNEHLHRLMQLSQGNPEQPTRPAKKRTPLEQLEDELTALEDKIASGYATDRERAEYAQKTAEYQAMKEHLVMKVAPSKSGQIAQQEYKQTLGNISGVMEQTRYYNEQVQALNKQAFSIGLRPGMSDDEKRKIIAKHPEYQKASKDLLALGNTIAQQHEAIAKGLGKAGKVGVDTREAESLYQDMQADNSFHTDTPIHPPEQHKTGFSQLAERIEAAIRAVMERIASLFRGREAGKEHDETGPRMR